MSAALQPYVKKLDDALAEKNMLTEYLQIAQDKTGLPKRNIVLGMFESHHIIMYRLIFCFSEYGYNTPKMCYCFFG